MTKVGIGYRQEIATWILSFPEEIECLEITAEHFFRAGGDILDNLKSRLPVCVHGLGMSLGTPGPLDPYRLERFTNVAIRASAVWISEHIAYTRAGGTDLGHLNPIPRTSESLEIVVRNAKQLIAATDRPLLLENITAILDPGGDLEETEFIRRICESADVDILLDVTNLFINSHNHQYDPLQWLHRLPGERIRQLHIVGYTEKNGYLHDSHSHKIQEEVLELMKTIVEYGNVEAIILERDENFDIAEIQHELRRIKDAL